ncbi:hypothetical protein [Bittarella massiliensis (ex Durand et al. 2017)]|uniref:hypothetical protein n=1 Tax=Bittarella massiliensis (ex Durand et al. 2017) TaxID=1720313 RepID=UPI001AA185A8|nr:hypothetical protein [Bittarella massiliensis (ex Durand et al. 2017)]MBO1678534.1 hypothetical protein [Bittarella massiliensis (ex Durand et al. 2017)]
MFFFDALGAPHTEARERENWAKIALYCGQEAGQNSFDRKICLYPIFAYSLFALCFPVRHICFPLLFEGRLI